MPLAATYNTEMRKRVANGPFSLSDDTAYQAWREQKLASYPVDAESLCVDITDPFHLSVDEGSAVMDRVSRANMAIYRCMSGRSDDKRIPRQLGLFFGLQRLDGNLCADNDGISSIQVMTGREGRQQGYIPYTRRPINWHTDGYYNDDEHRINGMLLHCARPALVGGVNAVLDPEIAYIFMRDEDPALVEAFMQPDAMTIPANVENGVEIRPAQTGPVFSVAPETGALHMRYTARGRNISWKNDGKTEAADNFLKGLLNSDLAYIFRIRLEAGQGLICNNVLHNRSPFEDSGVSGEQRLIYRARYYDRMSRTGLVDCGTAV